MRCTLHLRVDERVYTRSPLAKVRSKDEALNYHMLHSFYLYASRSVPFHALSHSPITLNVSSHFPLISSSTQSLPYCNLNGTSLPSATPSPLTRSITTCTNFTGSPGCFRSSPAKYSICALETPHKPHSPTASSANSPSRANSSETSPAQSPAS